MDILVLGGGPSGMMAAIAAAELGASVSLLERQSRLGRKLLATGNGRCNLSNLHAAPVHYHGENPDFCRPALERFPVRDTLERFRALGLVTVSEPSGRIYPFSNQANSVLDVLRFALNRLHVRVETSQEVLKIWKRKNGWLLKTAEGSFEGNRVILAAGGAAGQKLGGSVSGYALLEKLGHRRTAIFPALVQLVAGDGITKALKGIRAQAGLAVLDGGTVLARACGEVQFTETGVSGPAIFEISRAVSVRCPGPLLQLDLTPQLDRQTLLALLQSRCETFPALTSEDLLTGVVHNRLGRVLVKSSGISGTTPLSKLDDTSLVWVAETVKQFSLRCTGTQGLDNAQVTAGGIATDSFSPDTLESQLCPGLYACGEVLDIDGDCGGYNLQWAWSSGLLAGISAAKEE